jgi:hypothetical protein
VDAEPAGADEEAAGVDEEPAGDGVVAVAWTGGAGSDVEPVSVVTCGSSVKVSTP